MSTLNIFGVGGGQWLHVNLVFQGHFSVPYVICISKILINVDAGGKLLVLLIDTENFFKVLENRREDMPKI